MTTQAERPVQAADPPEETPAPKAAEAPKRPATARTAQPSAAAKAVRQARPATGPMIIAGLLVATMGELMLWQAPRLIFIAVNVAAVLVLLLWRRRGAQKARAARSTAGRTAGTPGGGRRSGTPLSGRTGSGSRLGGMSGGRTGRGGLLGSLTGGRLGTSRGGSGGLPGGRSGGGGLGGGRTSSAGGRTGGLRGLLGGGGRHAATGSRTGAGGGAGRTSTPGAATSRGRGGLLGGLRSAAGKVGGTLGGGGRPGARPSGPSGPGGTRPGTTSGRPGGGFVKGVKDFFGGVRQGAAIAPKPGVKPTPGTPTATGPGRKPAAGPTTTPGPRATTPGQKPINTRGLLGTFEESKGGSDMSLRDRLGKGGGARSPIPSADGSRNPLGPPLIRTTPANPFKIRAGQMAHPPHTTGGGTRPATGSAGFRPAPDDQSLFAAGAGLAAAPGAFEEFARQLRVYRASLEETPMTKAIIDQIDQAAVVVSRLGSDSESWHGSYRRAHEADIQRVEAPRGGSHSVEQKADNRAAQNDGM